MGEITYPDNKVHWANMGPIWVLSAPDGSHVGPMNLAHRISMPEFKLIDAYNERGPLLSSTFSRHSGKAVGESFCLEKKKASPSPTGGRNNLSQPCNSFI